MADTTSSGFARSRARLGRHPRLVATVFLVVAIAAWSAVIGAAVVAYDITMGLPGRGELASVTDMAQATTLYDASDRPVFTIFKEQRIEVPLSSVSPLLVRAVIAIEDQRFYDHRGIDPVRIAASVLANLREGRAAQGGSTITQQLARQSFLTRDKTLRRKLKEVLLAARLETAFSKPEILELYLNKVYFGDGLHGIEAASRGYLGKSASELDLAEAALLAGLIQSPSAYAPTVNLDRALARRNTVLRAMLETGVISRAEYEQAVASRPKLRNTLQRDEPFGLYFKEAVRRELVERFGWPRVAEGGLHVYTTIDSRLQKAAEVLLEQGIRRIERQRGFEGPRRDALTSYPENQTPPYLQGALVAVDPQNGSVRAMVGGRDFKESRFNRATQARRQPGSAFKPFVFAAGLEAGLTPATLLTQLHDPVLTPEGEWVPEDEHSAAEAMTVRTALRTSSNRAAVRLLRTVGIERAVSYIERLSMGDIPAVPSIALGTGELTLLTMTEAYAAFANGGKVRPPTLIRRVEDSQGRILYAARDTPTQAVSETTAFLMANMLADVVNAGTGYRARQAGFTLPAAGKTGTTNDYHDAWFVGFTPRIVAGVWLGFDQPRTIIANGYAGELAVPIWAAFMKEATRGDPPEWLKRPKNVVAVDICRMSGKRPSEGCSAVEVTSRDGEVTVRSMVYTEYFVRGTEPHDQCELHPTRSLFEQIAGVFGKDGPEPVPAEQAGLPERPEAAPAAQAGPAQPQAEAREDEAEKQVEPAPKKKRGFWARLFGRGGDDKDDKSDDKKKDEDDDPERKDD